jgi:hypothetical protein
MRDDINILIVMMTVVVVSTSVTTMICSIVMEVGVLETAMKPGVVVMMMTVVHLRVSAAVGTHLLTSLTPHVRFAINTGILQMSVGDAMQTVMIMIMRHAMKKVHMVMDTNWYMDTCATGHIIGQLNKLHTRNDYKIVTKSTMLVHKYILVD